MTNKYFDPNIELRPIKFLANYYASRSGEIWEWKDNNWVLLKPRTYNSYYFVSVFTLEMKWKDYAVHRLVAFAWLGKPDNPNAICCHKNDIKNDNRVDNLYWGTYSSNSEDYHKNKHKEEYLTANRELLEKYKEKSNKDRERQKRSRDKAVNSFLQHRQQYKTNIKELLEFFDKINTGDGQ